MEKRFSLSVDGEGGYRNSVHRPSRRCIRQRGVLRRFHWGGFSEGFGCKWLVVALAGLTFMSGVVVALRLTETLRAPHEGCITLNAVTRQGGVA